MLFRVVSGGYLRIYIGYILIPELLKLSTKPFCAKR